MISSRINHFSESHEYSSSRFSYCEAIFIEALCPEWAIQMIAAIKNPACSGGIFC
jgi:hypothetical protein